MLDTLKSEIKTSLLAGDRFRVDVLKMAQASLMNARIAKMSDLTNQEEVQVIQKEIKKRKEASEMYSGAGAQDRADKELQEVTILEQFVPKQLTGDELVSAVDEFITNNPGLTFADAMKLALQELGDNVDRAQLAQLLKSKLS